MRLLVLSALLLIGLPLWAQKAPEAKHPKPKEKPKEWKKLKPGLYEGVASFYGERFRGKRTHTDEVFDPDKLTAACNALPLHTWVKVTNLRNSHTVTLRINDRMHPRNRRLIDVSARAARELGFYASGLTRVRLEVLKGPPPPDKVEK